MNKSVTGSDIWMAARFLVDQHGATAAMRAAERAKLTTDRSDREIWLLIERQIEGRAKPREPGAAAIW